MPCFESNSALPGYTGPSYNSKEDCEAACIQCGNDDSLCPEGRKCCAPLIGAYPNTVAYDTANSQCLEVPEQFYEERTSCFGSLGPGFSTTGLTGSFSLPSAGGLFYVGAGFVLRDLSNIPIADWLTVSLTANGTTVNLMETDPGAEFRRTANLGVTFCKPSGQTSVDYTITYTTIEPYPPEAALPVWDGLCYRNVNFLNIEPNFVYAGFNVSAGHVNSNTCPCDWLSDIQP